MRVAVDPTLFPYPVSPKGRLEYERMANGAVQPVVHVGILDNFDPDIEVKIVGDHFGEVIDAVDRWAAGDPTGLVEMWPTLSPNVEIVRPPKDPMKTHLGTLTKKIFMDHGPFVLVNPSLMSAFIHQEVFGRTSVLFTQHPDNSHAKHVSEFVRKVEKKGMWNISVISKEDVELDVRYFLGSDGHPWFERALYVFLEVNPFHSYAFSRMISGIITTPQHYKFSYSRGHKTYYYEYPRSPLFRRYPWMTYAPYYKTWFVRGRSDLASLNGVFNICTTLLTYAPQQEFGDMPFEMSGQIYLPCEPNYVPMEIAGSTVYVIADKEFLYDVNDGTEVTSRNQYIKKYAIQLGLRPWPMVRGRVRAVAYPGSVRFVTLGGLPVDFNLRQVRSIITKRETGYPGSVSMRSGQYCVVVPVGDSSCEDFLHHEGISYRVELGDMNPGTDFEVLSPIMVGRLSVSIAQVRPYSDDVLSIVPLNRRPYKAPILPSKLGFRGTVAVDRGIGRYSAFIPPSLLGKKINVKCVRAYEYSLFHVYDMSAFRYDHQLKQFVNDSGMFQLLDDMFYVPSTKMLYLLSTATDVPDLRYYMDLLLAQYMDMASSWTVGNGFLIPCCAYLTHHLGLSVLHSLHRGESGLTANNLYVVDGDREEDEEELLGGVPFVFDDE